MEHRASDKYLQTSYKLTPVLDPYASKVDLTETVDGWFVPTMPDLNQRNPKAGITETPKTWDEFKTVVQKLKDAGITPIAVGGKDDLRDTVDADSTSGVVDQRIHGATLQDVGSHLLHLGLIGEVGRPVLAANLLGEGLQTLATPGHGDDLPPPFGEESGSCLPNSGRGSSNNDATRSVHRATVISPGTHRRAPTHT